MAEAGVPGGATSLWFGLLAPTGTLGLSHWRGDVAAARAGMSERTAAVHVSHILAKLSARNRAEAIATAHRTGAVRAPS